MGALETVIDIAVRVFCRINERLGRRLSVNTVVMHVLQMAYNGRSVIIPCK